MNTIPLSLSKKYTKDSLNGLGALKGAPCTIKSTKKVDGITTIEFEWTGNDGTTNNSSIKINDGANGLDGAPGADGANGADGVGIENLVVNSDNHLIVTLTDGSSVDAGLINITIDAGEDVDLTPYLKKEEAVNAYVAKEAGKSLVSDTEIARLASVNNYDDTELRTEIGKKANTTDIPTVPTKVSELENDSNYLTEHQDLSGYALKTEIPDVSGFLTNVPEEYVTETELSVKGYITEHQDLSEYAKSADVTSEISTEISKIVANAPEDLNTLKEMSDWIAGHENDASAMNSAISDNASAIAELQTGKADKSEIPSLTGYAKTTDLHSHTNKTVLDGITSTKVSNWDAAKTHADSAHAPSTAQANVIESVKVNGTALSVINKAVDVKVPTKVSELTNDRGYIIIDDTKSSDTTTYSSTKIDSKLNLRREIRIGEIYDSNGYHKILVRGYYARPIYFRVVASNGGEEILSFGQAVVNSRKVIGKEVKTKFRYITPSANGEKGTLLLHSNASEISLTIFCTYIYGIESTPIIEASTAEEFNSGTEFTTIDKIGSTDISAIGDGTITGAIDTVNSNLDTLEYGDIAGGKNLVYKRIKNANIETNGTIIATTEATDIHIAKVESGKTYTFTADSTVYAFYSVEPNLGIKSYDSSRVTSGSRTIKIPSGVSYLAFRTLNTYTSPMIEEGTTATDYEPYIPSVKMLYDKTTQIDDLNVLGWVVPDKMSVRNYRNSDVFYQKVNRVNLSNFTWTYDTTNKFWYSTNTALNNMKLGMNIPFVSDYPMTSLWHNEENIVRLYSASTSSPSGYLYYELAEENAISIYGNEITAKMNNNLGGLTFSASGTTLSITDGTNTWTLEANS